MKPQRRGVNKATTRATQTGRLPKSLRHTLALISNLFIEDFILQFTLQPATAHWVSECTVARVEPFLGSVCTHTLLNERPPYKHEPDT